MTKVTKSETIQTIQTTPCCHLLLVRNIPSIMLYLVE